MIKIQALFSAVAFFSVAAHSFEPLKIYQEGKDEVSLAQALSTVRPGQVIVLGEEHGTLEQARQQVQIMTHLRNQGLKVSVGMEFFDFTQQADVDDYRSGSISEEEFLSKTKWGQGFPFEAYREQLLFPTSGDSYLIALNSPRSLTGRISKVGWEGLSPDELKLLPPNLEIGNPGYLRRFSEIMGGHVPEASLNRYFQAQSTWDDTMAFQTTEFLKAHPDQVLVIVVGEFHVQYGGGLPDRLRQRGIQPLTFSLVNLEGLSPEEVDESLLPTALDGARADFIWTSLIPRIQ